MDRGHGIPGWHGKLPTLGDFATRRLSPAFVQHWDAWLSQGLAGLQARRRDWLDAYLASPSWRFLLMPGVLPSAVSDSAWVGVLMPSVDRVGRYYPLTLAQPLTALPRHGDELDALWRWLLQLDEAAADALLDDWDIAALETELARLGAPPTPTPLQPHEPATRVFAAQASTLWQAQARGQAFWYGETDLAAPRLLSSQGLDAAVVAQLLGDNAAPSPQNPSL
jgi:type VI secretion system protein ImpM